MTRRVRRIVLYGSKIYKVPSGKTIRVVGGILHHITGTDSVLHAKDDAGFSWMSFIRVGAAVANSTLFLNDKVTTNIVSVPEPAHTPLDDGLQLELLGDAAAYVNLVLVEEDV